MSKNKTSTIAVRGTAVSILTGKDGDYISLTDMLRAKDGEFFISDWLRNRNTVEFLGIWESVFNPAFNYGEFAIIKSQAGLNSYKLSVKEWVEKTNAIGLKATAGRYGGTFAHPDIAFEFGMWISPEFKIYLVKEFRRLKDDENDRLKLGWNLQRTLAKINYRIHTDAIKETLIPPSITKAQAALVYANEADLLNVALFGQTAKQWRDAHPGRRGQHPRPRSAGAARRPHQSRKPQFRAHPSRPAPAGTPPHAERNRDLSDAHAPFRQQRQTPEVMLDTATIRRLAVMNLALRGIEADFGPEHADTFRRDLRSDMNRESVDWMQTHSRNRIGNLTNLKSK